MYPVNGNKGIVKGQFFQGVGCIPYEISRKLYIGKPIAEKRRSLELVRFLAETIPSTERSASDILDRLERNDSPLSPGIFNTALSGLMLILDERDISLAFRASARLAVNFPDEDGYCPPRRSKGFDIVRSATRAIFRTVHDWERRQTGKVNMETVNRLRSNLLYFIGYSIGSDRGKRPLVGRRELGRIARLIDDGHPGVIDNSILCMRKALEKDRKAWDGLSEILPSIMKRRSHEDKDIASEAEKVIELLKGYGIIQGPCAPEKNGTDDVTGGNGAGYIQIAEV